MIPILEYCAEEVRFWTNQRAYIETRMSREEYCAGLLNAITFALQMRERFESTGEHPVS